MAEVLSKPPRSSATQGPPADRSPGRRGRTAILAVAGVLSLLLAVGSGVVVAAILHFESEIQAEAIEPGPDCQQQNCLKHVDPVCPRNICNFLLLGSDSRAGLGREAEAAVPGQRADTIIVVRTDPTRHRTVVLSIPRDLLVPIPGHGMNKINTAFGYGPDVMVQTVENLTGMTINHYAEVNFVGFADLVNALGGVPVCIDKPLVDQLAGLALPKAGCYNLRGAQALAYVRARHIQGDIIPDFSRIARQQQFFRAVIQKSLSIGAIFKISQLVAATKHNLVIDKKLDLYSLQTLTKTLADLGQQAVEFRVLPARPVVIDNIDYVEAVQPEASELLRRIRRGAWLGTIGKEAEGTPISTANITVQVLDANSGGKAEQVVSYLQRAGFVVLPLQPAPPDLTRSELLWGHRSGSVQRVLASYLTTLPGFYDNAHTRGAIQTVVIGPDFKGIL
jgi:LCP family protein required for cell wall assembly